MKKSSQITLGASLVLFLAAGSIKYWPEDRWNPAALTAESRMAQMSQGVMPVVRSFAPGWDKNDVPLPKETTPGGQRGTPSSPFVMTERESLTYATPVPTVEEQSRIKAKTLVSLTAQKMPVGEVLARLFGQAGVPFALAGQWDEPITITFSNAPLDQAINQTLSQTVRPRLVCYQDKGNYIVSSSDYSNPPPTD